MITIFRCALTLSTIALFATISWSLKIEKWYYDKNTGAIAEKTIILGVPIFKVCENSISLYIKKSRPEVARKWETSADGYPAKIRVVMDSKTAFLLLKNEDDRKKLSFALLDFLNERCSEKEYYEILDQMPRIP